jgi:hypothetical protein
MAGMDSEYFKNAATRILAYYMNKTYPLGSDYSDDALFFVEHIMDAVRIEIETSLKEKGLIE